MYCETKEVTCHIPNIPVTEGLVYFKIHYMTDHCYMQVNAICTPWRLLNIDSDAHFQVLQFEKFILNIVSKAKN